jgi:hypothetical protein
MVAQAGQRIVEPRKDEARNVGPDDEGLPEDQKGDQRTEREDDVQQAVQHGGAPPHTQPRE